MHKNSQLLFTKYAAPMFGTEMRVLEIGPDALPSTYRRLVPATVKQWDTLELAAQASPGITYTAVDEYSFPVSSDSYDVVLSGQVIEHVRKVWVWMRELTRIVRPGGLIITVSPITWHYHEQPIDCWRIYPEGMKALCDDCGLEVLVATWESVEMAKYGNYMSDRMRERQLLPRLSGLVGLMHSVLKFPIEGAYDAITIARKPPTP